MLHDKLMGVNNTLAFFDGELQVQTHLVAIFIASTLLCILEEALDGRRLFADAASFGRLVAEGSNR